MYKINNDYSYLARMNSAREREKRDLLQLKRESETAMALMITAVIDGIIAVFAFLCYYS